MGTDVGRFHRTALESTEHGRAAVDAGGGTTIQPELHDGPSAGVQADNAVVVAFAVQDPDCAGLGVQVFRKQRQRFTDPQAGPVQDHDQARFLTPVAALLEQARRRAFTSSGSMVQAAACALVRRDVVDGGGSHGCEPQKLLRLRFYIEASLYCDYVYRSGRR